jgi:hypothetical protein
VHLTAARLGLGELNPVAEALEEPGGGFTHVREERVGQAGHEQGDPHAPHRAACAVCQGACARGGTCAGVELGGRLARRTPSSGWKIT